MSNPFYEQTGRYAAPRSLKFFLGGVALLTFLAAFFPSLSVILGLSTEGIDRFFYWQWLTYSFFEPSPRGLDGSLFIQLGFTLYLLWIFGSSLAEHFGARRFFSLFLGSALFSGLAAWMTLKTIHLQTLYISPAPALYACLFAWTILNAQAKILLFFTIPLSARVALYVLLGAAFLIYLSQRDFPSLAAMAISLFYAYLFTVLSQQILSPFSFLHPFERILIKILSKIKSWRIKKPKIYRSSKIFDIHSGKPILDDEDFLDSMLTRISLYGETCLSPEEKKRMDEIASRRKRK